MIRKTALLSVIALALAPAAAAGGWATAGISPLPDASGGEQTFTITVLRHGQTPTDGATPAIILTGPDGQELVFPAKPSGEVGKYTATVKWPESGTWSFAVNDGLEGTRYGASRTHTLKAVTITGTGGSDGGLILQLGLGIGTLTALALALAVWRLRSTPEQAAKAA